MGRVQDFLHSNNTYVSLIGVSIIGSMGVTLGSIVYLTVGSLILGLIVTAVDPETFGTVPFGFYCGLSVAWANLEADVAGSIMCITGMLGSTVLYCVVLMSVGQIYVDKYETMIDNMNEIKQELLNEGLLKVVDGDDLHTKEGVTVKQMIQVCMESETVYPEINSSSKKHAEKFSEVQKEKAEEKYLRSLESMDDQEKNDKKDDIAAVTNEVNMTKLDEQSQSDQDVQHIVEDEIPLKRVPAYE